MFQNLPKSLSPTLSAVRNDGSSVTLREGSNLTPRLNLIPRSACVFRRIKLLSQNRAGLKAASFQVQQELGFQAPRSLVIADGKDSKQASVWSWETEIADEAGNLTPDHLRGLTTFPESLVRKGLEEGARLVRCIDGVEGEIWSQGYLLASRWWPAEPTEEEWQFFLRSARVSVDTSAALTKGIPTPIEPEWITGIPPVQIDDRSLSASLSPSRVAAILAVVALAIVCFDLTKIGLHTFQVHNIEHRLSENSEARANLARLRRVSLARNVQSGGLASVGDESLLVEALASTLSILPADLLVYRRINFSVDELTIEASARNPVDGTAIVEQLEADPLIREAFVESAQGNQLVTVRVRITAPPFDSQGSGEGV